jgi:hypothetical protein
MVGPFELEVGHLSCLVEVLYFACLEEVLSLVDRLVSYLEVGRLNLVDLLVSFLVVGHLDLVEVLSILLVVLYCHLVVVLQLCFQFFLLKHQLSKLPQAHHHQLYWLKYLDLSTIP